MKVTELQAHRLSHARAELAIVLNEIKRQTLTSAEIADMKILEEGVQHVEVFTCSMQIKGKRG